MRIKKMRRNLSLFLVILLLLPSTLVNGGRSNVTLAADQVPDSEPNNLISNGDFEDLTEDGLPAEWLQVKYSGTPLYSVDESVFKSGERSYKVSADTVSRASIRQFIDLPEDAVDKTYKMQQWMKTEDLSEDGKVYLRYQFLNSAGSRIGGIHYLPGAFITETTDWTLYEQEFTVPSGAVRINLEATIDNTTGSAWFDDTQLFEIDMDGNPVIPDPEVPEPDPDPEPEEPIIDLDNLILNGDFENLTEDGLPTDWLQVKYSGTPVYSVDESVFKSGERSYKVSADTVSRASIRQFIDLPEDAVGKTYKMQQWVKTEDLSEDGKVYLRYQILNSAGSRIGGIHYLPGSFITETTDWTLYEQEFTVPNGAVRINLEATIDNTTGVAWFDGIRLSEVLPYVGEDGNLLPNGGFESTEVSSAWEGGIGASDTGVWKASGSPQFTVDETVYRSGAKSVSIHGQTESRGALVQSITTMKREQPYLVSGWYKTQDVSNSIYVRLQYQRDNDSGGTVNINLGLLNGISGTHDWTYFSQIVTLPASSKADNLVKLESFLENSTGTVWFDDFSIKEYVPLEEFVLDANMLDLSVGQVSKINPIFTPENASNKDLSWKSSHPDIVSVSSDGEVTGISSGYSVITATSYENNIYSTRSSLVSVDLQAPSSLSIESYNGNVMENGALFDNLSASDSTGAEIVFEKVSEPNYGKVTVSSDGSFKYYPDRGYVGTDNFIFLAKTAEGGPKFEVATITVDVSDTAPVLDMIWHTTNKGTELTATLGRVISVSGPVTWSKAGEPDHGTLTVESDGSFNYIPEADFVGYDTFLVTASTSPDVSTTDEVKVHVIPEKVDFETGLNETVGENVHPRVIATEEDFSNMRSLIGTDEHYTEWVDRTIEATAEFMESEDNGLSTNNLLNTALLYQLTQEQKYADRAIQHLEFLATSDAVAWPGTYNSMLSLSYIAYTTGLAYDWLYNEMTPEQRESVEEVISEHIFKHALGWYRGQTSIQETNNINFVDNGSFGLLALAVLDEGGTVGDEAVEVLQGVYNKLQIALRHQTEDGTWPEGPEYWQFGTQPLFMFMAGMNSSIGTDFGLFDLPGMEEIGYYPLNLHGQGGIFNFADSENALSIQPQLLWLADVHNNPELAWYPIYLYEEHDIFTPLYLLFYKPGMFDAEPPVHLDHAYPGVSVVTMRSDWTDPNGVYAAMKGFKDDLKSHVDMDAGTFVFDALGERWALDTGNESYNLPGFWDYTGQRWTYYRKGLQGHNSVIINPTDNPLLMQDPNASAELIDHDSKPLGSYGIFDMTDRYPNDAASFQRGMMLTNERKELIVQDEMILKSASELYWTMHTEASISVIEDGRAAILTQNDKKLYVKMLEAPEDAMFSEMSAEALPGTPNPSGQSINHGIRKLAVHLTGVEEADLSIWMVPLNAEDPLPTESPAFTKMSEWTIPDGELPERPVLPTVNAITVDGQLVSEFKPSETHYKVVVPFRDTVIPQVEVESDFETSIVKATTVPGNTLIYVTDPANPSVQNRYTVEFVRGPIVGNPAEMNQWPVVGDVIASATPQADQGHTPDTTIDGDLITRWASEGSHWIQYDLGEEREVGAVSLAYISGDVRQAYFSIMTSMDGEEWTTVYADGVSSGLTLEPEVFHFLSTQARYVRINAFGNSTSAWNSLAEVAIFRTTPITISMDTSATWEIGDERELEVMLGYYDGEQSEAQDVVFVSSDPTILSVDDQGVATALKAGTAELTVTDQEFGLSDTWTIVVKEEEPDESTINDATLKSLKYKVSPNHLETVPGFEGNTTKYTIDMPYGTSVVPQVSAESTSSGAKVEIKQASNVTGVAIIKVTAENGSTSHTYRVKFKEMKKPKKE